MKLIDVFESKISGDKAGIAMNAMVSYIQRKLGVTLVKIPGIEQYSNSIESGYGYRYSFSGTTQMIRFNWTSEPKAGRTAEIQSIDIFTGKRDPSFNITTKNISLVRSLPALVTVLQSPSVGKRRVFPVAAAEALSEQVLREAKRDDFTAEQALTDFLRQLAAGKTLTRSDFIGQYHIVHAGIFDTIASDFKDSFEVSGKRVGLGGNVKVDEIKKDILAKAGVLDVHTGGSGEEYGETRAEAAAHEAEERISYRDTLEHLEGLVTGIVKGAFNALFIAGKGGTGKTQTVETVLGKYGLHDGDGYFKNTGSASAVGVYTLLYQNRNGIIVFDDSDGALADTDARNLIKAATDTKKKRKIVWNKKSSFIFDPEDDNAEEYEDDPSMAPKYFDFEGRIIFISNLSLAKLDPDGALRTRAFIINVDPTDAELFDFMESILFDIKLEDGLSLAKDQRLAVLDVVKSSKRTAGLSLRKLVRALNLAASGVPNWQKLVELYA